ncbi:NAD-P-binding protein [Lentinus brumalis]|uniref:NAD-P-binding protein n=1 Tax=Lentinus brumalis TaxID=2498619 RepID=A0A371D8A6_9APHY|nr:NAD-P-binding protein [Polyporus brumalis]
MPDPRVWFITGASTGLGRALAELILEKDEVVVATVRSPAVLEDLSPHAFSRAKAAFGRIDVVVNNAGVAELGEVELVDEAKARAVLETNFWGALNVTKEAIRFFRDDNPPGAGGRLLQMSSYLGITGLAGAGFYVSSKFALEGITETLAQEIDPKWNIKITLLEPGWIRSAMASRVTWPPEHPAYAGNASLPTNALRHGRFGDFVTWKDTRRSVEVFYKAASIPDPPLHLLVGKDAVDAARKKIASLTESVVKYEAWSEGLEE